MRTQKPIPSQSDDDHYSCFRAVSDFVNGSVHPGIFEGVRRGTRQFIAVAATVLVFASGVAKGVINEIGPFEGVVSEGFEGMETGPNYVSQLSVLGGAGMVRTVDGTPTIIVTIGWEGEGIGWPHGDRLFMGSSQGAVEWVFDTPAQKFGGYFATVMNVSDATALFYDAEGNLLDALRVNVPASPWIRPWAWNGWESTDANIKRVQIIGNFGLGGFIMQDDMQFTPVPEPCTLLLVGLGGMLLGCRRWPKKVSKR
jgi:hypothetical protein